MDGPGRDSEVPSLTGSPGRRGVLRRVAGPNRAPGSRSPGTAGAGGQVPASGGLGQGTPVAEPVEPGAMSGLFGRRLLYVVVAALPILTATVVSPVLAYQLGPTGLGLMASAIALHQLLYVVSVVGLDQALVLQRTEDGHDRSARGLIAVGTTFAGAVTVVATLGGPVWSGALGFGHFDLLVLATVLWTVPAATVQLALALLMAQDRLLAFTVVNCLSTVGSQLAGLVLVFLVDRSPQVYALGGVGGQTAAMLIAVAVVRPRVRGLLERPVVVRAVRLGLPLMLSGLSAFVLNAGDRLIIQRLLGSGEAGRYQVAYVVGIIGVHVLLFTGQAWASRITEVRDEAVRWALLGRSRDELYAVFAPVASGVVLGAPLALRVLAPGSFDPGPLLPVVCLVVLSGFPVVAGLATSRALVTARRTKPLALATALAAAVNVALNVLVVPVWGLVGAGAVTVVSFGLQAWVQRRSLPGGRRWPRTPVRRSLALTATCALAAGSVLLPQTPAWIALRTGLAVLCIPWLLHAVRRAQREPATAR